MLSVFHYAQNYAGIIGRSLIQLSLILFIFIFLLLYIKLAINQSLEGVLGSYAPLLDLYKAILYSYVCRHTANGKFQHKM